MYINNQILFCTKNGYPTDRKTKYIANIKAITLKNFSEVLSIFLIVLLSFSAIGLYNDALTTGPIFQTLIN